MRRCLAAVSSVLLFSMPTFGQEQTSGTNNLAASPGFEEPAGSEGVLPVKWAYYSSKQPSCGITREACRGGQQAVKVSAQKVKGAAQGLLYDLQAEAGQKYTFSAFVKNSKTEPLGGSVEGSLVIEWKKADGSEISREISPRWDSKLSRLRWENFAINQAVAPPGTTVARFGIHLGDGQEGGVGSFLVDDAVISRN